MTLLSWLLMNINIDDTIYSMILYIFGSAVKNKDMCRGGFLLNIFYMINKWFIPYFMYVHSEVKTILTHANLHWRHRSESFITFANEITWYIFTDTISTDIVGSQVTFVDI